MGENDESCPLVWKTKTLCRVVNSTVSAETCAMTEALDTAYFTSEVLPEILFNEPINVKSVQHRIPITAYEDNESLFRNTHSTTMASENLLLLSKCLNKINCILLNGYLQSNNLSIA